MSACQEQTHADPSRQLREVGHDVEDLRIRIDSASNEFHEVAAQRAVAERRRRKTAEVCERARKALSAIDQSNTEMQCSSIEQGEQQSASRADQGRLIAELDVSTKNFEKRMLDLNAELENQRLKATALSNALRPKCEHKDQEFAADATVDSYTGEASKLEHDNSRVGALRTQLADALDKLERLKLETADRDEKAHMAKTALGADRERLQNVELAASAKRGEFSNRNRQIEEELRCSAILRVEAEKIEREIGVHSCRLLQLDRQVIEGRNDRTKLENHWESAESWFRQLQISPSDRHQDLVESVDCARKQLAGVDSAIANVSHRLLKAETRSEHMAARADQLATDEPLLEELLENIQVKVDSGETVLSDAKILVTKWRAESAGVMAGLARTGVELGEAHSNYLASEGKAGIAQKMVDVLGSELAELTSELDPIRGAGERLLDRRDKFEEAAVENQMRNQNRRRAVDLTGEHFRERQIVHARSLTEQENAKQEVLNRLAEDIQALAPAALEFQEEAEIAKIGCSHLRAKLEELTASDNKIKAELGNWLLHVGEAREKQKQAQQQYDDLHDEIAVARDHLGHFRLTAINAKKEMCCLRQDLESEISFAHKRAFALEEKTRAMLVDRLGHVKSEADGLTRSTKSLFVEVQKIRQEMNSVDSSFARQVGHVKLQENSSELLEEQATELERQTVDLTLRLRDVDLRGECLQKQYELLEVWFSGAFNESLDSYVEDYRVQKSKIQADMLEALANLWKTAVDDLAADANGEIFRLRQMKGGSDELERPEEGVVHGRAILTSLKERLRDLIAAENKMSMDFDRVFPEKMSGLRSLPPSLHGFGSRLAEISTSPDGTNGKRKAVVVGCNYSQSHAPLLGCTNDAFNIQSLLRQTLHYAENEVLSLVERTETCPTPLIRQPTRENILAGLGWLVKDASPGDRLLLFFSGYGVQVPATGATRCTSNPHVGMYHSCLLPTDFAADLPRDFFSACQNGCQGVAEPKMNGGTAGYRLVSMADVTAALSKLPENCNVTVILDSCYGLIPGLTTLDQKTEAEPPIAPRVEPPMGTPRSVVPNREWRRVEELQPKSMCKTRWLDLPLTRPLECSCVKINFACQCFCYAACRPNQCCNEVAIEGCVQGAFTWAFVKAFTVGHLDTTVAKHLESLRSVMHNIQTHCWWADQTPQVQLSSRSSLKDPFLPIH